MPQSNKPKLEKSAERAKALARARSIRYQQNRIENGLCANCGNEPLVTSRLGAVCLVKQRERVRKTSGAKKRWKNSVSYTVAKGL